MLSAAVSWEEDDQRRRQRCALSSYGGEGMGEGMLRWRAGRLRRFERTGWQASGWVSEGSNSGRQAREAVTDLSHSWSTERSSSHTCCHVSTRRKHVCEYSSVTEQERERHCRVCPMRHGTPIRGQHTWCRCHTTRRIRN